MSQSSRDWNKISHGVEFHRHGEAHRKEHSVIRNEVGRAVMVTKVDKKHLKNVGPIRHCEPF